MATRIGALGIAIVLLWSPSASASNDSAAAAYLLGVVTVTMIGIPIAGNADPEDDYDRKGPYAGAGATLGFDVFTEDLNEMLPAGVEAKVASSIGATARLGYRIHPHFAAEAAFEWLSGFDISVDGDASGSEAAEVETWIVTGNAKGYLLTGSIQPFALVGAGSMRAKIEDELDLGIAVSEIDLALRFGAGVDLYLTQRFVMDVGLDYVYPTGDLKDFDYISIGVGLQYRF
jgi:hypothetical protein